MKLSTNPALPLAVSLGLILSAGCGRSDYDTAEESDSSGDSSEAASDPEGEGDHPHAEDPLGTVTIGELEVTFAQGHGGVVAAKEGHLVVKLPYNDAGATTVRAWIGTEDRMQSLVGKGEYAASHDDYDVHAMAPDPLPENPMWWVEIEQPDGTKLVGSVQPLFE